MTSEQVMLAAALLLLGGCGLLRAPGADPLVSPYPERRVWAVVPLRNESGSLQVDGAAVADHLARQLENAFNIDVLPVNRTFAAMDALQLRQVDSPAQVKKLLATLGADGLIVGAVTAYDPYDPPKLGMSIELYQSDRIAAQEPLDVRRLTSAATDRTVLPAPSAASGPASLVSAYFDAADPDVRRKLQRYGRDRGVRSHEPDEWRRYRISMDLYTEFVSYVMSWRLLSAETQRLAPPPPAEPAR